MLLTALSACSTLNGDIVVTNTADSAATNTEDKPLLSADDKLVAKDADPDPQVIADIVAANGSLNWQKNEELEQLLDAYISKKNFDKAHIAIDFRNFTTGHSYALNPDKYFVAASTYKFYLATMYYDLIDQGKVKLDDKYRLDSNELNAGGVIDNTYKVGDFISVGELLHDMIIYSDNSAGHMLFNELGDYVAMKKLAAKYVDVNADSSYLSYENIVKANFLADFAALVYADQDKYATLIKDLQQAEPNSYLNFLPEMSKKMAQKYGRYELACNSVGLCLEPDMTYVLVILTDMSGYGERIMGEISSLIYNYYKKGKEAALTVIDEAEVLNYSQPANVWYVEGGTDNNNGGNTNNMQLNYTADAYQNNYGAAPEVAEDTYDDTGAAFGPDGVADENPVNFTPVDEKEPVFIPDTP